MSLFILTVLFTLISIVVLQNYDGQALEARYEYVLPPDHSACSRRSNTIKDPLPYKWIAMKRTKPINYEDNFTPQSLTDSNPNQQFNIESNNNLFISDPLQADSALDNKIPSIHSREGPINDFSLTKQLPYVDNHEAFTHPSTEKYDLHLSSEEVLQTAPNDNRLGRGNRRNNNAIFSVAPYQELQIINRAPTVKSVHPTTNCEEKEIRPSGSRRSMSGNDNDQVEPSIDKSMDHTSMPQQLTENKDTMESTDDVSTMRRSKGIFQGKSQVCFACSTANNPNCWAPDGKTTIKYCSKGHNACITKTFGEGSSLTLIRDCGKSCDDSEVGGIGPKVKECSVCHNDLCNAAYSINTYNLMYSLILLCVTKYIFN